MQRTFAFLLALASTASAQAQNRDAEAYCAAIGAFARTIMQNRQAGAAMSDMMAEKAPSPAFQELGQTLIEAAFREPVAGSEEMRQRAVNAFAKATTAACAATGAEER